MVGLDLNPDLSDCLRDGHVNKAGESQAILEVVLEQTGKENSLFIKTAEDTSQVSAGGARSQLATMGETSV